METSQVVFVYQIRIYLCTDGKAYMWHYDRHKMSKIAFFKTKAEAQAAIDKYNNSVSVDIAELVVYDEQRRNILRLKNMVKELRCGFKPELIVELYNFVERM